MDEEKIEIGQLVLVPCRVVGIGQFAYTESVVLDLSPVDSSSGAPYNKVFTVYVDDVITEG